MVAIVQSLGLGNSISIICVLAAKEAGPPPVSIYARFRATTAWETV